MSDAINVAIPSALDRAPEAVDPRPALGRSWYALWTRSHCERLVHDQLVAKGFEVLLPMMEIWSRRRGLSHRVRVPMFPSYLFVHHELDKASDVEIGKTRGLVGLLGDRWDRRAVVPDGEIEAIRVAIGARVPVLPHPYLRVGQRARITGGPLAGVQGILVRTKPGRGLLVLSVQMVRQSVAVEVDCTLAEPA